MVKIEVRTSRVSLWRKMDSVKKAEGSVAEANKTPSILFAGRALNKCKAVKKSFSWRAISLFIIIHDD